MEQEEKNNAKPAGDKIHSMFDRTEKAANNLSYNEDENSYELDRDSEDPDYDHPLPYETTAQDGSDDNSSYDEANPYVGDEYEARARGEENVLDDPSIRIDHSDNILKVSKADELLSRTEEDKRDDLDEEGYPKNNVKKKF